MNTENTEQNILHKMAAYCSTAERCVQDIESKLKNTDLDDEARERIIARLKQERFIDEGRFSRFFVNDKLRFNKWGRIKISFELKRKGISGIDAEEALSGIDEEEYRNTLYDILKSKKKTVKGKDERDVFYKLLRFAAGRGFETSISTKCIKEILNSIEDYDESYL